jgi:DNA replication protein DnaC
MVKNIHSLIKTEYDKRQKSAHDIFVSKREDVYNAIPGFSEIDSEIQLLGVKHNRAILLGNSSVDAATSELLYRMTELKNKKDKLLINAGYPRDYLDMKYLCPICNDTGYLQSGSMSEKCACYKQYFLNLLYKQSNLKLTESENFDSFNESYYPAEVNVAKYGIEVSPRENIVFIKDSCLKFVNNFSSVDEKNLFFCGPTGVGKTFMANCIAAELLKSGVTILYQTSTMLFNAINEYKMKAFKEEGFEDSGYKDIFEAELLIIDDLGTESPSAARYAELLNILNTRHLNNLTKPCKTIISTNISIKKLHEYYDERIVSRIIGNFDMFMFVGEDIRSQLRMSD